jgi:Insertion element 4 transposase N-terminal/Transposase DDE domain
MCLRLRQIALDDKLCHQVRLEMLESIIPSEIVQQVLTEGEAWEKRERKLNMQVMVYLILALSLFPHASYTHVFDKVSAGLRHLWPEEVDRPSKAAISVRRCQLGEKPLQVLFERLVQPIATAQTRGAFRFGLRLVAVDSTLDNVADTPANQEAFGYNGAGEARSPFPQVRCVYLAECGTHIFFDVLLSPCRGSEEEQAATLIARSLTKGMLLLWDRGFRDTTLMRLVRKQGAHVLGRLPAMSLTRYVWALDDGTYLAVIYTDQAHQRGDPMLVRIIEYTITDPQVPGASSVHRLVTTLLNPRLYPALELVETYHERWEIETSIDEYKTHQRLSARTLRSLTPEGVRQELYGMLLTHFAIRSLMHQSALQADLDPDRLSFTHALAALDAATWRFAITPQAEHPALLCALLQDLRRELLPPRRLRLNPRVVKRVRSKFDRKLPQHFKAPDLKRPFLDIVALI